MDELAGREYEALQSEKRDRMNSRLQIWSLLVALVGGFGLASLQMGNVSYVVGFYPFLAACVARYAGHSEAMLDRVKAYLLQFEERYGYEGYEHYNWAMKRCGLTGSHIRALRDAILLTDVLAVVVAAVHLAADRGVGVAGAVVGVESVVIVVTCVWLRDQSK